MAVVDRGKTVIISKEKMFVVGDHDFTRLSITPSLALLLDLPEDIEMAHFIVGRYILG